MLKNQEHRLAIAPMKDRIEGLDFETVEGLGHMPQFVEPDRVIAFIKRIAERAFAGRNISSD
jgi:pimeloyl-ACP methyl ester carboxylesterase